MAERVAVLSRHLSGNIGKLSGKKCLITGAGSGIGREAALLFAKQGATIIIWDLVMENMLKVQKEIRDFGGECYVYQCDVSKKEVIETLAEKITNELGFVDIVVNNAGIFTGKYTMEYTDKEIDREIDINLKSVIWMTRCFLAKMLKQNKGDIVNVSSAASILSPPRLAIYGAAKSGVFSFSDSLRTELHNAKYAKKQELVKNVRSNVRLHIVLPYYTNTGMFAGVKSPIPFFPLQDTKYVAKSIVDSVIKNRAVCFAPPRCTVVYATHMIPVSMRDALADYLGLNMSLKEFTGYDRWTKALEEQSKVQ